MNWRQINRGRIKHIRYGERLFARMYADIRLSLFERIKSGQSITAIEDLVNTFQIAGFDKYFEQFYTSVGVEYARQTYRLHTRKKSQEFEAIWTRQMLEFVKGRCGKKITLSMRNHFEDIVKITRRVIREGIDPGWGPDRVAREINRSIKEMDRWKALRIARTEIIGAQSQGSLKGVESTGIAVNKIWLATSDGSTRDDHLMADGQGVALNSKFDVGGERLEYPGDPNGSPENIINCRCAMVYEPID